MGVTSSNAYAKAGGTQCPCCGSTAIKGDAVNIEAGTASQEIECKRCHANWCDAYQLTGYTDLETGEI